MFKSCIGLAFIGVISLCLCERAIGDEPEAVPGCGEAQPPPRPQTIPAALHWIARHQSDLNWTMDYGNGERCKDKSCTGRGTLQSDSLATSLAVLPLLAAGQTQERGYYKEQIGKGLVWLLKWQTLDGDLSGEQHLTLAHGVASIVLCEAFGMTNDEHLKLPAQKAIAFLESAQNKDGGWGKSAKDEHSDLFVFGWQVIALKSAGLAGLQVKPQTLDNARVYLKTLALADGKYAASPGGKADPAATAIGLFCYELLEPQRDSPTVKAAVDYLVANLPQVKEQDPVYWFFAIQALHIAGGAEWEQWHKAIRHMLIDEQTKTECATGSWSPELAKSGAEDGRLMVTSISCLTLEVYYRYLPLFKLDKNETEKAAPASEAAEKKTE